MGDYLLPRGLTAEDLAAFRRGRMRPTVGLPVASVLGMPAWDVINYGQGRSERHVALIGATPMIRSEPFHGTLQGALMHCGGQVGLRMDLYSPEVNFEWSAQADARADILMHPRRHDAIVMDVAGLNEAETDELNRFGVAIDKPVIVVDQLPRPELTYAPNIILVGVSDVLGGTLAAQAADDEATGMEPGVRALALSVADKEKRGETFAELVRSSGQRWRVEAQHYPELRPGQSSDVVYNLFLRAHEAGDPIRVLFGNCDWLLHDAFVPLERLVKERDMLRPRIIGYDGLEVTSTKQGHEAIVRSVIQDPVRIGLGAVEALTRGFCDMPTASSVCVAAELWLPGTPRPVVEYKNTAVSGDLKDQVFGVMDFVGARLERNRDPTDPVVTRAMAWLLSLRRH